MISMFTQRVADIASVHHTNYSNWSLYESCLEPENMIQPYMLTHRLFGEDVLP
jgi:hypothetical protein